MQETASLARNNNPNTKVYRYLTRMILGLLASIIFGLWLDQQLHTLPLITLGLVIYVIVGTLYLLIKEAG